MTEVLRERAAAGVGVVFSQPPARPRRGRLRGRRDHRPRPDRRRGRDRRAQGGVRPAPPRGRGRRRRTAPGSTARRGTRRCSSGTATWSSCSSTTAADLSGLLARARGGRARCAGSPSSRRRCPSCSWRPSPATGHAPSRRRWPDEPLAEHLRSSPGARSSSAAGAAASSSACLVHDAPRHRLVRPPALIFRDDDDHDGRRRRAAARRARRRPSTASRGPVRPRRSRSSLPRHRGRRRPRLNDGTVDAVVVVPADLSGRARSGSRSRPDQVGRASSSRSAVVASATQVVLDGRRRPGARRGRAGRRRSSALEPQTETDETAFIFANIGAVLDPHRDLHVRVHGPDRGRRGEAEPGRRGRPLDRPARDLLIGKVLGIGLLGLVQLAVFVIAGLVAALAHRPVRRCPTTTPGRRRDAAGLVHPRLHAVLDGARGPRCPRVADGGGVERVEPGDDGRDASATSSRSSRSIDDPAGRVATIATFLPPSRRWSCRCGRRSMRSPPWRSALAVVVTSRRSGCCSSSAAGSTPARCSRPAAGCKLRDAWRAAGEYRASDGPAGRRVLAGPSGSNRPACRRRARTRPARRRGARRGPRATRPASALAV